MAFRETLESQTLASRKQNNSSAQCAILICFGSTEICITSGLRLWEMMLRFRPVNCLRAQNANAISTRVCSIDAARSNFSEAASSSSSGEPEAGFQGARVSLNWWQQAAVAVGSAVGAAMNPARADLVAALGETTGSFAFQRMLERMKQSSEGQKILLERPRVTSTAMARAWDMPENTFGAAYARFMGSRNFSPDDRPPVRFMETEELAYVATRAREVHDFWHVLFNLPTSVMGELALKMVEFQQTTLPMCFLSVTGASWRLKPEHRDALFRNYLPWAVRAGRSATDLICVYYENHLHEDLDEVRSKWGIIPAPSYKKK